MFKKYICRNSLRAFFKNDIIIIYKGKQVTAHNSGNLRVFHTKIPVSGRNVRIYMRTVFHAYIPVQTWPEDYLRIQRTLKQAIFPLR